MKEKDKGDQCQFVGQTPSIFNFFQCCLPQPFENKFLQKSPPSNFQPNISKFQYARKKSLKQFSKIKSLKPNCDQQIQKNSRFSQAPLQTIYLPKSTNQLSTSPNHKYRKSLPQFVSPPKKELKFQTSSWNKNLLQSNINLHAQQSQKSLWTEKTQKSSITWQTNIPQKGYSNPLYSQLSPTSKKNDVSLISPFLKKKERDSILSQKSDEINKHLSILENDLLGQFSIKEVFSEGEDSEKSQDQFSQLYLSPHFSQTFETKPKEFKFQKKFSQPFTLGIKTQP